MKIQRCGMQIAPFCPTRQSSVTHWCIVPGRAIIGIKKRVRKWWVWWKFCWCFEWKKIRVWWFQVAPHRSCVQCTVHVQDQFIPLCPWFYTSQVMQFLLTPTVAKGNTYINKSIWNIFGLPDLQSLTTMQTINQVPSFNYVFRLLHTSTNGSLVNFWVGGLDSWDCSYERECYLGDSPRIPSHPKHPKPPNKSISWLNTGICVTNLWFLTGAAPDESVAVAVYCPPVLSSNYMWIHRCQDAKTTNAWKGPKNDGLLGRKEKVAPAAASTMAMFLVSLLNFWWVNLFKKVIMSWIFLEFFKKFQIDRWFRWWMGLVISAYHESLAAKGWWVARTMI